MGMRLKRFQLVSNELTEATLLLILMLFINKMICRDVMICSPINNKCKEKEKINVHKTIFEIPCQLIYYEYCYGTFL